MAEADILEAQADCIRRGWIRDLGGGRFEITEKGQQALHLRRVFNIKPVN